MISKIVTEISNIFKKDNKSSITKQDLLQHIGILNQRIKNFLDVYSDKKDIFIKLYPVMMDNRINKDKKYIQAYFEYKSSIIPKASKLEQVQVLSTLVEVLSSIHSNLIDLKENIDKYVGEAEVNKFNMKISHVGVLNFIKIAEHTCNYTYFLFNGIIKELLKNFNYELASKLLPKYRINYINKYNKLIVFIINKHYNNNIFKDVLTSITELKKEGKDLFINNNTDGESNAELAGTILRANPLVLINVLSFDSIPLMIGQIYHDILHWWYTRLQKEKDWMETRVALLRLEMNNVDPDSDEYKNISKIADNYDLLITEADSKLNNYFLE